MIKNIVESRNYFAGYQIRKRNELDLQLVEETSKKVELDGQLAKETEEEKKLDRQLAEATKKKVELDRQLAKETKIKEELDRQLAKETKIKEELEATEKKEELDRELAEATEKKEELLLDELQEEYRKQEEKVVGLEEEKWKQEIKVVELEEEKRKQHEKVVRLEKVVRDQEEVFVRLAEEDNKKQTEASEQAVEEGRKKEEIGLKLEPTVYQVANYNFVFQGVILTATIHGASTLKSNFICYPFALSVIASILNFVTLLVISMRYNNCLDDVDEKTHMWYIGQYIDTNNPAPDIDEGEKRLHEKHNWQKLVRNIFFGIAMLLFLVFSAVVGAVIWKIPGYVRTTDKSS